MNRGVASVPVVTAVVEEDFEGRVFGISVGISDVKFEGWCGGRESEGERRRLSVVSSLGSWSGDCLSEGEFIDSVTIEMVGNGRLGRMGSGRVGLGAVR